MAKKKAVARRCSYKQARKKGHDFEREVANALGHVFPEAKRNLEYQADEAQEGVDIANTGIYDIQCKNKQNYCSIKTIREVKVKEGRRQVLITKGNRMEPMVIMPFVQWVEMLEEIRGREELEANWNDHRSLKELERDQAIRDVEVKALPMKPEFLDDLI